MKQSSKPKGLVALMDRFTCEADCLNYLKHLMYENKTPSACPRCKHTVIYTFKDNHTYKCAGCRKKFNVLTGTIYENSKISLRKWFFAVHLVCTQKRGISSYQLAEYIQVTQKTAWFMLQRIRTLYRKTEPEQLEGLVCADETYVGGKNKNKHWNKRTRGQRSRGASDKISVFGIMQIDGKIITRAVRSVDKDALFPVINKFVKPLSTIMTDEWTGYKGLSEKYYHFTSDHSKYEYVNRDNGSTTNPIENYWAHIKRSIMGTYYHISRKHIHRYLSEFDYKFNHRNLNGDERFNVTMLQLQGTRLNYKTLIANA